LDDEMKAVEMCGICGRLKGNLRERDHLEDLEVEGMDRPSGL
jgi:hypothetical protein